MGNTGRLPEQACSIRVVDGLQKWPTTKKFKQSSYDRVGRTWDIRERVFLEARRIVSRCNCLAASGYTADENATRHLCLCVCDRPRAWPQCSRTSILEKHVMGARGFFESADGQMRWAVMRVLGLEKDFSRSPQNDTLIVLSSPRIDRVKTQPEPFDAAQGERPSI